MNAQDISTLVGLGTGKNSTVTKTSGRNLSAEEVNALIKKQLESTQGLASVTGAERVAGMYNSTVNSQLVNDLMARTAAEAAAKSTATTETTSAKEKAALNPLKTLGVATIIDKSNRDKASELIGMLVDTAKESYAGLTTDTAANILSSSNPLEDYSALTSSLGGWDGTSSLLTDENAWANLTSAGETASDLVTSWML